MITLLSILAGLSAAGLGWYAAIIARQVSYVTLADGRQQERAIPLLFRMLLPLCPNMLPLVRRPFLKSAREVTTRRILAAGLEGAMSSEELLSLKVLLPLVAGPFWFLFVGMSVSVSPFQVVRNIAPFLHMIGPLWLYVYPTLWLRKTLAKRHLSIQRALPFLLDLLTLSVEAGLDFMTALQRNIDRRAMDPLGEEMIRVVREIQIGKTRREALRDMAIRVDLSDIRSVVGALVQADELGVSIGFILRIQADQMRQRRFERAEKLASEAPVKMLFPLMVFIFPAVFLILLGPIVMRVVEQGF